MKQAFHMVKGTTEHLALTITDANGSTYSLQSGEVLHFAVKRNPEDSSAVFSVDATQENESNSAYVFDIEPQDTSGIQPGLYWYDIGLQSGSDYYIIVECSEFRIDPSISERSVST